MKIYVLLKGSETICVSEDIDKILNSTCEDFDREDFDENYSELEIWKYGEMIYRTTGNDVLKKIVEIKLENYGVSNQDFIIGKEKV